MFSESAVKETPSLYERILKYAAIGRETVK